jgi:DNA mismatch endonuclease (patch repair protein)
MMSGIKGKNSTPERMVRQALFAAGYRFRLHRRDLPGTPDVTMSGRKIVVFVHGCFWHAHKDCKYAKVTATRPDFWIEKFQANVARDERAVDKLTAMGWRVLVVWECATRNEETSRVLQAKLTEWINGNSQFGEIRGPVTTLST